MFPQATNLPRETNYEHYKVKKKFGGALRRYLNTDFPCKKLIPYVGIERQAFRNYITSQLSQGMTMDNFGQFWVLDHIVPLFLFDHASKEDLKIAWNYINLIPMPIMLNRLKGVSVEFSQHELAKRMKYFPGNSALPLLVERMNTFSNMMLSLVSDDQRLLEISQWAH